MRKAPGAGGLGGVKTGYSVLLSAFDSDFFCIILCRLSGGGEMSALILLKDSCGDDVKIFIGHVYASGLYRHTCKICTFSVKVSMESTLQMFAGNSISGSECSDVTSLAVVELPSPPVATPNTEYIPSLSGLDGVAYKTL